VHGDTLHDPTQVLVKAHHLKITIDETSRRASRRGSNVSASRSASHRQIRGRPTIDASARNIATTRVGRLVRAEGRSISYWSIANLTTKATHCESHRVVFPTRISPSPRVTSSEARKGALGTAIVSYGAFADDTWDDHGGGAINKITPNNINGCATISRPPHLSHTIYHGDPIY